MDFDVLGIKITGDVSGYDKALKQGESMTDSAAVAMGQSMDGVTEDVMKSAGDAAKAVGDTMAKITEAASKPLPPIELEVISPDMKAAMDGQGSEGAAKAAEAVKTANSDMTKSTDAAGKQMDSSMKQAGKGMEEGVGKGADKASGKAAMMASAMKTASDIALKGWNLFSSGVMAAATGIVGAIGSIVSSAFSMVRSLIPLRDLSFTGLWNSFKEGIDEAVELDRQARRVGASILDLRAGALWAGVSVMSMAGALSTTNTKLTELRYGNVTTTKEFENLAAVSGVSVDKLTTGWGAVYDAIAAIQDPTARAAQAFRFLGGNASEFLDALQRGSAGAGMSMAKRFGLELTPGDIASMQQVQLFLRQIEGVQQGVFNQVLAGFAPLVAEIMALMDGVKVDVEFIKPLVLDIVDAVGHFGAQVVAVATNSELLKKAFAAIGFAAQGLAGTFQAAMLEAIGAILSAMSPLKAVFGDLGESLKKQAEEVRFIAKGDYATSGRLFGNIGREANRSETVKGFDSFMGRVRERAASPGPTREKENADFLRKLTDSFRGLTEGLKTPIDNWKQGLMDFKAYTGTGFFKGDSGQDTRAFAALKMVDTLRQQVGASATPQFAGAAMSDTREAFSAALQYSALGQRATPEEEIKRLTEIANQQREAQRDYGRRAADALDGILAEMEDAGEVDLD